MGARALLLQIDCTVIVLELSKFISFRPFTTKSDGGGRRGVGNADHNRSCLFTNRQDRSTYSHPCTVVDVSKQTRVPHELRNIQSSQNMVISHISRSWRSSKDFTDESLDLKRRILKKSGTGQTTARPPGITQVLKGREYDGSIEASQTEAEAVIFPIVQEALNKANLHPRDRGAYLSRSFTPKLRGRLCTRSVTPAPSVSGTSWSISRNIRRATR